MVAKWGGNGNMGLGKEEKKGGVCTCKPDVS